MATGWHLPTSAPSTGWRARGNSCPSAHRSAHLSHANHDGSHGEAARGARHFRPRAAVGMNVRAVSTLERYAKGMFVVHLRSGAKVISSRYHQTGLRGLLCSEG